MEFKDLTQAINLIQKDNKDIEELFDGVTNHFLIRVASRADIYHKFPKSMLFEISFNMRMKITTAIMDILYVRVNMYLKSPSAKSLFKYAKCKVKKDAFDKITFIFILNFNDDYVKDD